MEAGEKRIWTASPPARRFPPPYAACLESAWLEPCGCPAGEVRRILIRQSCVSPIHKDRARPDFADFRDPAGPLKGRMLSRLSLRVLLLMAETRQSSVHHDAK